MDEMIDFEELIDLNISLLSVSQRSLQGPISDVLDKMCEAMDESHLATDNILNNDSWDKVINVLNENKVGETAFRIISVTEFLNADTIENNETDDISVTQNTTTDAQNNKNGESILNDDLEEFECFLAAKYLENYSNEPKTDNFTTHEEENVKNEMDEIVNEGVIDLEEFEGILGTESSNNNCVEYASNEYDIGNTSTSNQYEVKNELNSNALNDNVIDLDEFERFLDNNVIKSHVEEKNLEIANSFTTSEEHFKTENDKKYSDEHFIDLDEFMNQGDGVENYLKNSLTESNLQKYVRTIVPYEIPLEFAVENKSRSEAVTEQTHYEIFNIENCLKNSHSEDGYNSSDFEFISEDEASKAGIINKFNKENSNNGSVNNLKLPRTSTMFQSKTSILNSRKNEASLSDYIKYSKYRFQRCYFRSSMSDENHAIPVGEQYLDMFRGANAPVVMNDLYTMRNKSIVPPVLMAVNSVDHEDLMFRVSADDENCEHKDDAKESVNKILATYPHENRRKRRRH